MKLTEKRTPHQIARKIIVNGKPSRSKYGQFRWGKLKLTRSPCDTLYLSAERRGIDIYFYVFGGSQARSVRDILGRALPY